MGFYTMFDPLYWLLVGPTILLALLAQGWVKSAYGKWSKVRNSQGMSGAQAAIEMLTREGVRDCTIQQTRGWLSDHYDPRTKTLNLSPDVYNGRSVAAVGIACHEAGHALQHAASYAPLSIRNAIVPVASIGSKLAWPLIAIGMLLLMFSGSGLGLLMAKIGVVLFGAAVIFQIITLPVEFNASSRAKTALVRNGVLTNDQEIGGVNSVLNAAAMTYIAAAITALAQLLYFAIRLGLLGGRD